MFRTGTPILAGRLGSTPDDYTRMCIECSVIKPWEDGMRTDGSPGTYEWWYFDAHLDDGTRLVVGFQTKQSTALDKPTSPVIRIDLTLPGGTPLQQLVEPDAETFSASAES